MGDQRIRAILKFGNGQIHVIKSDKLVGDGYHKINYRGDDRNVQVSEKESNDALCWYHVVNFRAGIRRE